MADIAHLHFRLATSEDAARIQHLVQSAFCTEDSRPDWTGNLELASQFRVELAEVLAKIADPNIVTLLVEENGGNESNALVASIDVSRSGADCGRLSMIAVDDRHQRNGVGRHVLAYAEDYCRQNWGVTKFSLNALSSRPALIEWYVRRGYQKTGKTTPFPREKFSNLVLPSDMCFVELEKDFTALP